MIIGMLLNVRRRLGHERGAPEPGRVLSASSRNAGRVRQAGHQPGDLGDWDLHVRIALQEADSEKRRLINGGILLGPGAVASQFLVLANGCWVSWLWCSVGTKGSGLGLIQAVLACWPVDLVIAGLMLRIGGPNCSKALTSPDHRGPQPHHQGISGAEA